MAIYHILLHLNISFYAVSAAFVMLSLCATSALLLPLVHPSAALGMLVCSCEGEQ